MATSFGTTTGVFGIAAQQTGFLLESYYNERIEISLDGYEPSTSAFSGTLASAISLATAPADHLIGAVTGGTYIVQSVTRSSSSEDYRRISVKAKYSPTILA